MSPSPSPELKLQAVVSHPMWVLGTQLRASGRAALINAESSLQPFKTRVIQNNKQLFEGSHLDIRVVP